jgi:hypothetical protein
MGIEPMSEVWDEPAGNGFMPPSRGSVQIDTGGSRSGVFGALRVPATILRCVKDKGLLAPEQPLIFCGNPSRLLAKERLMCACG